MQYLLAASVIALFLYFRFGSKALAFILIALAGLLATRGLAIVSIPMLMFALYLLKQNSFFAKKIPGQTAKNPVVRSRFLEMQLDQKTGKLSGRVRAGTHTGMTCNQLSLKELLELLLIYKSSDAESEQLLMAYLDQAYPDWLSSIKDYERNQSKPASNRMTMREAFDILGLPPTATESEIKTAHRAMMKKFHPDHGGSAHLAASINQAKDLLLNEMS